MVLIKDGREVELTRESAISAYKNNGWEEKVVKQEKPESPVEKPAKKK